MSSCADNDPHHIRRNQKKRKIRLLANKAINPIFVCVGLLNRIQTYIFYSSHTHSTSNLTQIEEMIISGIRHYRSFIYFGLPLFFYQAVIGQNFRTGIDNNSDFIVVLDAGHGGFDPGNLGNGFIEKEIALNIALEIGKYLSTDPRIKVIYTRQNDTFVDLFKRGEIANKAKADLFVSIHCDSHSSSAHGAGTFVLGLHANQQNFEIAKKENSVIYLEDDYDTRYADYDINSPESVIGLTIMQEEFLEQSIQFGKLVQDKLTIDLGRQDRKVKQAGFIVLHQTFMPSVLIETGFLTNKAEGAYLNSKTGQREMGTAIANAIINYRSGIRSNSNPGQVIAVKNSAVSQQSNPVKPLEQEEFVENKPKAPVNSDATSKPAEKSTPEPIRNTVVSNDDTKATPEVLFRVQLIALSSEPTLKEPEFAELPYLQIEPVQNMFRVLYGNTTSLEEAERLKSFAIKHGFPAAYVIAYKNGKRVNVSDVVNTISQ